MLWFVNSCCSGNTASDGTIRRAVDGAMEPVSSGESSSGTRGWPCSLNTRIHESLAFMEIRFSAHLSSCFLCMGSIVLAAGFGLSCQAWVVILVIVKFWTKNHMCVLGKGPKKGLSATAEKCPERGHMWRMIYGCCGCNQVAILPQCFPRSAVANFITFADVFFGFCFCRFHLKTTIAPPLRVIEAARRRQ